MACRSVAEAHHPKGCTTPVLPLCAVEEAPPAGAAAPFASVAPEPPSAADWLADASAPGTGAEAGSLTLVLPLTGSTPPASFVPPSEKCVKKY